MKNYRTICKIGFALLLTIGFTACEPDDDVPTPPACTDQTNPACPNYDPCLGQNPVTAEFKIYDDVFTFGPNADTWYEDSVLRSGSIKLVALAMDDSAYYKWYLGQEIIEGYGDSVIIRGISNLDPGTYDAALVIEKTPNLMCFPGDIGRDSIYKTFTIVDKCDLQVINKFKGVFESAPNDSLVIEFLYINHNTKEPDCNSPDLGGINLRGLGDTTLTGNLMGVVNRYIKWVENEYTQPVGDFEVFPDNSCRAEYELRDEYYVFNGKLLPE